MKKLIFLDVDGTLTEPGCNVPPESALAAVRGARGKGNLVFLCTGRSLEMVEPLLQYGFDGVICSSGGYIEYQGRVIYDNPLSEDRKKLAMTVLEKNGIYRTVECKRGSYTDEGFKDFLRRHADEAGNSELLRWREQVESALNIRPMAEYEGQPAYKLVFICESPEQLEEPRRVLEKDFNFCVQDANEYGYFNGEMVSRSFDKGQAVRRICGYLGISVKDTVGFGDSMNDWEMMEVVGFGICMENGSEQLKALADDVCPAVSENGLRQAFEKYHLM